MEGIIRISIIVNGSILILFGIYHLFGPKFFKWEKHYPNLPPLFIDGILTTNFAASNLFIALGILDVVMMVFYWQDIGLIKFIIFIQCITMIIRFVYAVVKPLRFPKKGVYGYWLMFILVLCFLNIESFILLLNLK